MTSGAERHGDLRESKDLSENDYGRTDYFACGTLVVWDVDLLSEDVIKSYKASDPEHPVIFRRGDIADAEPAVPGWQMPVNDLFESSGAGR